MANPDGTPSKRDFADAARHNVGEAEKNLRKAAEHAGNAGDKSLQHKITKVAEEAGKVHKEVSEKLGGDKSKS